MKEEAAPKISWIVDFPSYRPSKDSLARIIDADGGRDEAENSYYEVFADPSYVRREAAERRFRGQYLRRLRRLANRDRVLRRGTTRPE
ncbi:hypothetical protein GCM10009764_50340 [Nocardia ninae]|uniref:Uncharacterized protein n=1 Tax=Nocardia ninae NBRC 108245 TaxID=1210091 RepID=A0A511M878_9NOCA|nr:hypothetical protein NN4_04250 [Nocardia ninae NBRC 108245]